MIEVLPALPVEQKPINPKDRFIDLLAMKQYGEYLNTRAPCARFFYDGLSFFEKLDVAVAWINGRDHEFDAGRGDYYR
jgi:hypothetical protein